MRFLSFFLFAALLLLHVQAGPLTCTACIVGVCGAGAAVCVTTVFVPPAFLACLSGVSASCPVLGGLCTLTCAAPTP